MINPLLFFLAFAYFVRVLNIWSYLGERIIRWPWKKVCSHTENIETNQIKPADHSIAKTGDQLWNVSCSKFFTAKLRETPPHPPQSKLKLLSVRSPWKASLHVEKRTVGIVLQLADGKTAGFPSVDSQHSYLRLALFLLTPPPSTLSKKEGFILWKSQ